MGTSGEPRVQKTSEVDGRSIALENTELLSISASRVRDPDQQRGVAITTSPGPLDLTRHVTNRSAATSQLTLSLLLRRTPCRLPRPMQPSSKSISQEQLEAEVKSIYAGLKLVERKCVSVNRARTPSPQISKKSLAPDGWQAWTALHRSLLHVYREFFLTLQYRGLEHTWVKCLCDLGRYRMIIEDRNPRTQDDWASIARSWKPRLADQDCLSAQLFRDLFIVARLHALQRLSSKAVKLIGDKIA